MDKLAQITGFWGKVAAFRDFHDSVIVTPAVLAAMVAPVFTLSFRGYRVPSGHLLRVKSVTVCSPWAQFTPANVEAHLVSDPLLGETGYVDYGAGVLPRIDGVRAYIVPPQTVPTQIVLPAGSALGVRVAGVPWAEFSGAGGGGVAAHIEADLLRED
jgi:hypothetical protein